MTQEKPGTLSRTVRIEIGSAASLITEATHASAGDVLVAVLRAVEAECGQIARSVAQDVYGLQSAEMEEESLRARAAAARAVLSVAEEAAGEGSRHGSWVKVTLWSLFAAACFDAEFVLTWTALCFVLNVHRMTVLGVLLGAAPPSGLAVLEIFLARLFEEPWQKVRGTAASGKKLGLTGPYFWSPFWFRLMGQSSSF